MENCKGDEGVPATPVPLGEVCGRRTGWREGVVADEPSDDGAGGLPERACLRGTMVVSVGAGCVRGNGRYVHDGDPMFQ